MGKTRLLSMNEPGSVGLNANAGDITVDNHFLAGRLYQQSFIGLDARSKKQQPKIYRQDQHITYKNRYIDIRIGRFQKDGDAIEDREDQKSWKGEFDQGEVRTQVQICRCEGDPNQRQSRQDPYTTSSPTQQSGNSASFEKRRPGHKENDQTKSNQNQRYAEKIKRHLFGLARKRLGQTQVGEKIPPKRVPYRVVMSIGAPWIKPHGRQGQTKKLQTACDR